MPHAIKIGSRILTVLALLSPLFSAAQEVQVRATVDRNEMHQGDTFVFALTASSNAAVAVDSPQLPDLSQFDVINTWTGTQARSTFTNGTFQVEQSRVFNYMLAPKSAGRLTIGAATLNVNGQSYRTEPIVITVKEGAAPAPQAQVQPGQPLPPDDPLEEAESIFDQLLRRRTQPGVGGGGLDGDPNDLFFIQLEADKTKAYAGEQVTASWWLYTRGQIRDIDTLKYPSLSGFWKEEIHLATRLDFQTEVINGIPYQKALLASFALFPIKKGFATIDPYQAKCTVVATNGFGFGRAVQITKQSQALKVTVMEVPTAGRPANYSGAVGRFAMNASLDQPSIPAGQPVTLRIRVEGRGNAKLIELPPLNLPPSVKIYDSKSEAKFNRDGSSFKSFEVLIIPNEQGTLTIPPLSIAGFDPNTGQFYEEKTAPLTLNVTAPTGEKAMESLPLTERARTRVEEELSLPPLALEWSESAGLLGLPKAAIWSVLYLLVFGFLIWRGFVEFGPRHQHRDLMELFRGRIKNLQDRVNKGEWRQVGAEGANTIYLVVGDLSGEGGASQALELLLAKAAPSVRREVGDQLTKSLSYFEALGFAPEGMVAQLKDKSEMKKRVQELETLLEKAIRLSGRWDEGAPVQEGRPV